MSKTLAPDTTYGLMTINRGYYTVAQTYMRFIIEWKKYFKSECCERVKSFFHEKINFICSSQGVIFFLLHRYKCFENKKTRCKTKKKQRNDVSDTFTSEDMENMSLVSRM